MEQFFHVGTITSPHGVRGDVKVYPTTDDKERFRDLKTVLLRKGEHEEGETRAIRDVRFLKNLVILQLEGVRDRNEAELLRGIELYVPREDAVPLEENQYYVADLIGMDVHTEDGRLGELVDVLQTGANDVYVVRSEQYGDVLIPAIRDCIRKVDVPGGKMDVHLLPGLVEEQKEKS